MFFRKNPLGGRCRCQQLNTWYRHFAENANQTENVRVRFAPSPTGDLHLGGLRTALYNYFFAKRRKGKFLLRIEDTDQTRLVPGATARLIENLNWAGIEIDEGPGCVDNSNAQKYGPYIQSERTQIYAKALEQLLNNGSAYRCFCTERRLELLRKEAARTRQIPRYDNKCRNLSEAQVDELLAKRTPYCVRFRLHDYLEPFHDLIYGKVQHNVASNEGDPVIMKSDQFPTYHFANVVDDHLMSITHVLRGVEWQISTTKHLLLYNAFGWQPPQFGHLPLLVNADGSKLSKRQGDIGVNYFRERGYYPLALVNYVVTAGGGFERTLAQKQQLQLYTMPELIAQFNIAHINAHPSRLNPDLLADLNRLHIKNSLTDKKTTGALIEEVRQIVKQNYADVENLDLSDEHILNVIHWSKNRLTFLQDLCTKELSFLWLRPTIVAQQQLLTTAQVNNLLRTLRSHDFQKEHLKQTLQLFSKAEKIKYPVLMKSLRAILSDLKEGPGVVEMMDILGKNVVLQRLEFACEKQKENTTQELETKKIEQ